MGKPDYAKLLSDVEELQQRVKKLEEVVSNFAPLQIKRDNK